MAGLLKEITDLPTANSTTVSDYLHIKQGVTDRKITWDDLFSAHTDRTDNPHNVTKTQLNIENVTNDAQLKIASNLSDLANTTTARGNLNVYSTSQVDTQHNSHANRTDNPHNVTKAQLQLNNVTNNAQLKIASNLGDLNNVSQARTNLDVYSKAEVNNSVGAHAGLTNNPHSVTKSQVGLSQLQNWGFSTSPTDGATNKYARADAVNALYNQVINAIIPIGGIILWSGDINSIPSNFKLCNGTSGTPDLRGSFVVGAGGTYDPNDTGGSATHKHNTTVGNTALTIDQIPAHSHSYTSRTKQGLIATSSPTPAGIDVETLQTGETGGGQPHGHTVNEPTVSNLPPYYALAYIMRTA